MKFLCLLLFSFPIFADLIDLESLAQEFILETKRIDIPGYPSAFNPSIIRWNGYILMSFRDIPNPKFPYSSVLGLILLDEAFNPIAEPQILSVPTKEPSIPPRAEDARLFYIGETLYIAYSDNPEPKLSKGGFRMEIGEIHFENGLFSIRNIDRITEYEGQSSTLREKSWVPFEYRDSLLLSYSINPHLVFRHIPGTNSCDTVALTAPKIPWNWGIIRGGTPALPLENGEYLSFFHSVKKMSTVNSNGKEIHHYFMGAYTFAREFPFPITRFSTEPIVGKGFYTGAAYKPYWGSIQCVFPAGLIMEQEIIWVSYGRQDHEIWIVKLDKRKLLDSLVTIKY
jgi:predicted GH43/DUF377 family glycosyl hydrolase